MSPGRGVDADADADADADVDVDVDVDVVVVGAGASGLTAARTLRQAGRSVLVLERDQRSGGRIRTEYRTAGRPSGPAGADEYREHGGIFHTEGYPAFRALLGELGLAEDVVALPTAFEAAIRAGGGWEHLDYGSLTGPLRSGALGWKDRISIVRAALPALAAKRTAGKDLGDLVTLAHLDTRPAAAGLTERAATYFTAGPHEFLWGVATEQISYAMLAMQLHVFKGELRELRGGAGRWIEAIAADLDIRHGVEATALEQDADGVLVRVRGGEPIRAGAVVLACPADVCARLWPTAPPPVRDHLASMTYSRIDYVYLRTREALACSVDRNPVGMAVITTPEVEGTIGGVYVANGWVRTGGLWLVTAANAAQAASKGSEQLADELQADTEKLYPEIIGQITDRQVMRHHQYTPTFSAGTVRRLAAARRALAGSRVDLAGDHMAAPWVEGAVRSGQLAAQRVHRLLA